MGIIDKADHMSKLGVMESCTKHRVCRCCRHASKNNHHSKAETIPKLTVIHNFHNDIFGYMDENADFNLTSPYFGQGVKSKDTLP